MEGHSSGSGGEDETEDGEEENLVPGGVDDEKEDAANAKSSAAMVPPISSASQQMDGVGPVRRTRSCSTLIDSLDARSASGSPKNLEQKEGNGKGAGGRKTNEEPVKDAGTSHDDGEERQCPSLTPCDANPRDITGIEKGDDSEPQPPPELSPEGFPSPRPPTLLASLGLTPKDKNERVITRSRSDSTVSSNGSGVSKEAAAVGSSIGRRQLRLPKQVTTSSVSNNPLKCQVCSKKFVFEYKLKIHMRLHNNERPFTCPESNCDKSYVDNANLQLHIKKFHHGSPGSKHLKPASTSTASAPALRSHTNKSTSPVATTEVPVAIIGERSGENKDDPDDSDETGAYPVLTLPKNHPFICPFCFISFRMNLALIDHLNAHIPLNAPNGSSTVSKEEVKHNPRKAGTSATKGSFNSNATNQRKITVTGRKCPICKKTSRTPSELQIHMRVHTGEKPFHCSICQYRFGRKDQWKNHMRNTHKMKGELVFPSIDKEGCLAKPSAKLKLNQVLRQTWAVKASDKNNAASSNSSGRNSTSIQKRRTKNGGRIGVNVDLPAHPNSKGPNRSVKTGNFKCLQCGKRYTRKENLAIHTRMEHTSSGKEKMLQCTLCDQSFKWRQSLKKHMTRHAIPTEVKPYACPSCPATFTWRQTLRRHLLQRCPGNQKKDN